MSGMTATSSSTAHSAYSFLDGASPPEELATAAAELGYEALALTDHDGVWGAMEFAQACRALGVRPIVGAELTVDAATPPRRFHLDAAGRGRCDGLANLCRLITEAHADTRPTPGARPPPPAVALDRARAASGGARLPLGLRPRRGARGAFERPAEAARRRRAAPRRSGGGWSAPSAASASGSSCSGRSGATTGRATAGWRELARAARRRLRGDRQRPHARPLAGARSRTRWSPCACAGRWRRRSPSGAGTRLGASRRAGGDGRPLRATIPDAVAESGAARRAARASTSPATSATATRARRTPTPTGRWPRSAGRGSSTATRASPSAARRERRLEEELRGDPLAAAVGVLPAPLRHPRAGPRGGGRGPGAGLGARRCCRPGAGRGSSVSSIVCYLTGLSHVDPVRNGLFLGRFLNEEITEAPDIDLDFPRDIREKLIPRVHERYGERALGAGRGVRLLPVARRDPRLRQGAGPAAGRDRARGADGRHVRPARVGRARHGGGDRRGAGRVGALAGAGPRWRARRGGCRATPPSTPAGW